MIIVSEGKAVLMVLLVLGVDKRGELAGSRCVRVRGPRGQRRGPGRRMSQCTSRRGAARITKRVIILTLSSHYSWVVVFYCRLTLYIIIIN